MTASDSPVKDSDDRDRIEWSRAAGRYQMIRIRALGEALAKGVAVTAVRLLEDDEGLYTVWLQLSDREGEFRLNLFKTDAPKTYRDVSLAIATVRDDFHFFGEIKVSTTRRLAPPDAG